VPPLRGRCGSPADAETNRYALIRSLFFELDRHARGTLNSAEVRSFAQVWGFQGDDDDWDTEFKQLLEYLGCELEQGIDAPAFSQLVNDTSARGCHCSDAALRMLRVSLRAAASPPSGAGLGPESAGPPKAAAIIESPLGVFF